MKVWAIKISKIIIGLAIFAWFGINLAHKIDLTTADLGRHIENGNIIVNGSWAQKWAVLHTNFYSYTLTNAPFINHHWFSGVVFYFIHLWFGFVGLSVFYVFLGLLTLWLFFDVAKKASNFWIASAVTICITPLITSRVEVRPEMFTYFFTGTFFWILWHWRENSNHPVSLREPPLLEKEGRAPRKWLWILPPIMLLWVNLHIGFVFGFLVLGAFGLEELIKVYAPFRASAAESRNLLNPDVNRSLHSSSDALVVGRDGIKKIFRSFLNLVYVSIACVIAALINPSFIRGFLYPLYIFKDYGYLIVENQSIKFLENISFTSGMHFLLFKAVAGLIAASLAAVAIKDWRKVDIAMLILALTTGVMAYLGIRNFPSFAFFALPALSANIYILIPKDLHPAYSSALAITACAIVVVLSNSQYQDFLQIKSALGFGLLPGVEDSANFFKQNNINGPIFNDYDVGSYLIYNLYPEKVFVDNRPEAYHTNFFQNIYIPAQENPDKWAELDSQYHFNAIFFSYRDYTPWAQAFLISRVQDPNWAPVFMDSYNIIFLKRDAQNQQIIKQYELPKSMFGQSQN